MPRLGHDNIYSQIQKISRFREWESPLMQKTELRQTLVQTALDWEKAFGNSPAVTCALSEYDAALLIGCSIEEYSAVMQGMTTTQRGFDFRYKGFRYQVKGNRPSGKPGSFVTWVPKATNYEWDYLVWILYTQQYEIAEAWLWDVDDYKKAFDSIKRLSPAHYRQGKNLLATA